MQTPRFRFTIGNLMACVAVSAVVLAYPPLLLFLLLLTAAILLIHIAAYLGVYILPTVVVQLVDLMFVRTTAACLRAIRGMSGRGAGRGEPTLAATREDGPPS